MVVPYCEGGQDRSAAAAAVIAYCLYEDQWQVNDELLYLNHQEEDLCQCPGCKCDILARREPFWWSALDMFRTTRKGKLYF